jgi:hypothetical protein
MDYDRGGVPILTKDNYNLWKLEISAILDSKDCLTIVNGTEPKPLIGINGNTGEHVRNWERSDAVARTIIGRSLDKDHWGYIQGKKTAKEWWDTIKEVRERREETDLLIASTEFYNLQWKPDQDVTAFLTEVKHLRNLLSEMGVTFKEVTVIAKVLQSLPPEYENFRQSWRLFSKPGSTIEDLYRELRAIEIEKRNSTLQTYKGEAFLSKEPESRRTQRDKFLGKTKESQDKENRECWYCGKKGHLKADCRKKNREDRNNYKGRKDSKHTLSAFAMTSITEENIWIGDSGAYAHITNKKEWFTDLREQQPPEAIQIGDGKTLHATMIGSIDIETSNGKVWTKTTLENVRYVPSFGDTSLLSIGMITGKGYTVLYKEDTVEISSRGKVILIGYKEGNIYRMAIRIKEGNKDGKHHALERISDREDRFTGAGKHRRALFSEREENKQETLKWHLRLAHPSKEKMKTLINNGAATGISLTSVTNFECSGCALGRSIKTPYGKPTTRETVPGRSIHSDVCGPLQERSAGGSSYYILFKDEATGYRFVYFMKQKSQALEMFKSFLSEVNQSNWKVSKLRTDNGREYVNHEFKRYLYNKGIKHETTSAYSPALNGIAERENRTLMEKATAMLFTNELPKRLWAEAVNTATYLMNRVPNRQETTVTPYEQWHGTKPDLGHLRIFGSVAYAHIPHQLRRKLDPTGKRVIFVGYTTSNKLFRVYDPERREVEVVRDLKFEENIPMKLVYRNEVWVPEVERPSRQNQETHHLSEQEGDDRLEESDYESNYESAEGEPQATERNYSASEDEYDLLQTQPEPQEAPLKRGPGRPKGAKNKVRAPSSPIQYNLRIRTPRLAMSATLDPQTYQDAKESEESKEWHKAIQEEINALNKNHTWTLVDKIPAGRKTIKSRWVFKKKLNPDGTLDKFKARLCAKGFTQRNGIDYQETFAPVARYESIRTLLAITAKHDLEMVQFDIKTAFLYGKLKEEIYIELPEGFPEPRPICKLNEGLYGLKQSPKCWNDTFNGFLESYGLSRSDNDPCVYFSQGRHGIIILGLYVDDGLLCCSSEKTMEDVIGKLQRQFEVTIEQPKCFIGLEIIRDQSRGTIEISQRAYLEKVLEKFNMQDCAPVASPGDHSLKLSTDHCPKTTEEKEEMKRIPYRQAIGSLMFAGVCTRPDILYEVCKCAQYSENPGRIHWTRVKRIMRYIKGTLDFKITYTKTTDQLLGFCDSDWAGCLDTRRSTTGYIFTLSGGPIAWGSRKQKTVALSSSEAEYMALGEAVKETLWLQALLKDIGQTVKPPTLLYVDNQGAIALAHNPIFHDRTKHIDAKHHFVREIIENGQVKLLHISSTLQPADLLTKTLDGQQIERCFQNLKEPPQELYPTRHSTSRSKVACTSKRGC